MPDNVGTICDLVEVYAGQGGVNRDRVNRRLLWKLLNLKMQEFARRTGILEKKSTITTTADQAEYELPDDVLHVRYVDFDGSRAHKATHDQVKILQDSVS
jgi:hypothetical protein